MEIRSKHTSDPEKLRVYAERKVAE
jgi:hypothetical protein